MGLEMPPAQCQVWTIKDSTLKQSLWEGAGYKDLNAYIKAIVNESKRALKKQGYSKNLYDDLPLCTFGRLDEEGVTHVELVCEDYVDLPTDTVKSAVVDKEGNDIYLIVFDKK